MTTELVQQSSNAAALMGAECDLQIQTARRFPRNPIACIDKATKIATSSQEIAESCKYLRPVGGGKDAEGPSIRLAEIVAATWGNLRAMAMIVSIGKDEVVARGMAWDLESNFAVSVDETKSLKKANGARVKESQVAVLAKATAAIAWRNAVIKCVGKTHFDSILRETEKVALGNKRSQKMRARQILDRLANAYGIDDARACAAVDAPTVDDLTPEQLDRLLGLGTSVKDNEIELDDAFPPLATAANGEGTKPPATPDGEFDLDSLTGEEG